MRSRRHHRGTGFDVWDVRDDQQAWFWLVIDSHRDGGIIGSAATEADAVREACASIEEISSHRWADFAALPATPQVHQADSLTSTGWKGSLANLERYLAGLNGATA
jgi:hypothetical protein